MKLYTDLQPRRSDYDLKTVTENVWTILEQCWTFEPHLRPAIEALVSQLCSTLSLSSLRSPPTRHPLRRFIAKAEYSSENVSPLPQTAPNPLNLDKTS